MHELLADLGEARPLRSLPYRLFFVIKRRKVEVLSVLHQSRDPGRWP